MTKSRNRRELDETEGEKKRAAERQQMQEAIEALRSSEGWQRWLTVRRHFHTYSFHNQLLIALQRPEATRVAGYRKWLALGYVVRKGERGLRIWAPCPPSKKRLDQWKRAGANPDQRPRTFFRLVAVFDRSQVEPLPEFPDGPVELSPPHEPIAGDGLAHLFEPMADFGRSLGLRIDIEPVSGAACGFHEPSTGRIVIDVAGPEFSTNAQLSTLVHELAHALVRIDRREDDPKLSYAEEEVVVESVAYTVCASVGLDTAGSAIPYMTGWAEGVGGEPIERYAALIDRLARRLEDVALAAALVPDLDAAGRRGLSPLAAGPWIDDAGSAAR
jgi:antirestriction protein ArdC